MANVGVNLVQNAYRLKPVAIPTKSDERGLSVKLASQCWLCTVNPILGRVCVGWWESLCVLGFNFKLTLMTAVISVNLVQNAYRLKPVAIPTKFAFADFL
ncbi:hypothetical protein AsFPU1_2535 [Aphanothece sacrum FPU1]|uniref:Uncharacterized protein n=1 Tax=Aphanothece sacrum FPU1 TaxID=1920663 RepID=A0A401IIK8_APHSA|nr:hypothetical protein AsFPU1_2535 [Aphanothece sacrum FPU1]GBF86221.1 hypothetical protein AsFPU3_3292 [Aphanothece sacrum FPU3]